MKKTGEETLKGCHISVDRLREERPMLVHNIIRSMHQFAQQAVKERNGEIIEKLNSLSNGYEVVAGCYVVQKNTLDQFIENLETKQP